MSVIVVTNLTLSKQVVSDLGFNLSPSQTRTISDFFDESDVIASKDLKNKIIAGILYVTIDSMIVTPTNTETMLTTAKVFDVPASKYWYAGDFRTATSADYLNTSANVYKLWTSFEYFGTTEDLRLGTE